MKAAYAIKADLVRMSSMDFHPCTDIPCLVRILNLVQILLIDIFLEVGQEVLDGFWDNVRLMFVLPLILQILSRVTCQSKPQAVKAYSNEFTVRNTRLFSFKKQLLFQYRCIPHSTTDYL